MLESKYTYSFTPFFPWSIWSTIVFTIKNNYHLTLNLTRYPVFYLATQSRKQGKDTWDHLIIKALTTILRNVAWKFKFPVSPNTGTNVPSLCWGCHLLAVSGYGNSDSPISGWVGSSSYDGTQWVYFIFDFLNSPPASIMIITNFLKHRACSVLFSYCVCYI